jgi:WD40 repeat protein
MSSADRPDRAERALLAAGTGTYASADYQALDKVPHALREVVATLKGLGFTTVIRPPGYRVNPKMKSLQADVEKAAAAAPVVVVYYTGHGAQPSGGTYYLVSQQSQPAALRATALAARDLLELLTLHDDMGDALPDDQQPTVLIILDCCFSGAAGMAVIEDMLRGIGNPSTWVISSASPLEYAQQGLFARAFCDALRRPTTGPSQRFVHPLTIVDAVNDVLSQEQQKALLFQPAAGAAHIPPFFPSFSYQPGLAGMTVADQHHWLSRVRGGPDETTAGFYLTGDTGRLRAAEDLSSWMTDPGPKRLAVVTGSPGSGKSALLALPVLLTEQSQRRDLLRAAAPGSLIEYTASLLPAEIPVTAIHARGLNTDQTAGAIALALGQEASTASGLLEVLDATPQQDEQVVVVDAVDEARSPSTLLGGLLVPLSRQPGIRVVIGARRHVLAGAGKTHTTIDLDASRYRDPGALTDYIHRLLIAAAERNVTTCYQSGSGTAGADPGLATVVAEAIAQRATAREGAESFLIGRLLALSVRGRPEPVDVTSPDWQSDLPATLAEAFDEDLARLGNAQPLARALLEALAWAKGPGLPWETIWVPVARALAERGGIPSTPSITNEGVRWLLDKAGAYVVEDVGPGLRSVFRPFHDLLAAHLRDEPSSEQTGADSAAERSWEQRRRRTEKAIIDALLATVPADGQTRPLWASAHPYLRTYLAQHAAAAGPDTLAALVQDMDFLAVADPVTLSPLLWPAVPELRDTARIYRRARPLVGGDVQANAAYLQEASRALTGTAAAPEGTRTRPLYRTHFASVRRDDSLLTFAGHADRVFSVAFGTTADGRLLLASGDYAGTVRLWDPVTGTPMAEPLTGDTGPVHSVAFGTTPDGHLLLACGSGDEGNAGTAQLWDPVTGTPMAEPLTDHTGPVISVALGTAPDGRLLLASGENWTVRLWDPVTGALIAGPLTCDTSVVAFGTTADGHLLLASGGQDVTVLWDPVTGTLTAEPFTGDTGQVDSVAFGTTPDGRLVLASGSGDATVRLWDPDTGTPTAETFTVDYVWVDSVAFGTTADGRLLLASGSNDATVRLWDPVTGTPMTEPFTGHTDWVNSVAFGTTADGRLLLASGSNDATVRLWDPVTPAPTAKPPTGHTGPVNSVAFGTAADGRLLLASGGEDQRVRLWDPVTGTPMTEPLTGHTGPVNSVTFGTAADGRLLLASGGEDQTVRLWDPVTGTPMTEPLTGHTDGVNSVAFGTAADGRLLLASGGQDTTVLWDPVTPAPTAEPFTGDKYNTGWVDSLAFGTTADGRLLLASGCGEVSTVRLWDPVTGTLMAESLEDIDWVSAVAFGATTDGRLLLAAGGQDATVLWDLVSPTAEPLIGHTGPVRSVAFGTTADGHLLLASGGDDRVVRLWDLTSKVCVAIVRRRSRVRSVAIIGPLLAIGDDEGVCVIEPRLAA